MQIQQAHRLPATGEEEVIDGGRLSADFENGFNGLGCGNVDPRGIWLPEKTQIELLQVIKMRQSNHGFRLISIHRSQIDLALLRYLQHLRRIVVIMHFSRIHTGCLLFYESFVCNRGMGE
jgi:hypothetical protein